MNRLLLGNCWQDNSRQDITAPYDTKARPCSHTLAYIISVNLLQLCSADSMFPTGHSGLPPPHYLQLGPRHEDQVVTFAVITFTRDEEEHRDKIRRLSTATEQESQLLIQ